MWRKNGSDWAGGVKFQPLIGLFLVGFQGDQISDPDGGFRLLDFNLHVNGLW